MIKVDLFYVIWFLRIFSSYYTKTLSENIDKVTVLKVVV